MNALLQLDGVAWWHVAGWTMLHYLWMGALVGVAALVSRVVLRRAAANVRYAAALTCLAVLAVLPVGIGIGVGQRLGVRDHVSGVGGTANTAAVEKHVIELTRTPAIETPPAPGSAGGILDLKRESDPVESVPATEAQTIGNPNTNSNPRQSRGLTDVLQWESVIQFGAEYLPWVWIVGAPLTFLLLTTGVVGAERLRQQSRVLRDGPVAEAAARIAESLQIGRRVTIAVCEQIAAPVLVGIVRPMILLPPAALTGWSPDEIEMVLLHELAHVRRWDNLVNLLQRLVEAVLFFQPAVWLVSNWVRREREACCDAVVVGRTNRPHAYAELLVALASQLPRSVLFHPAASSAMAAGPLRGRIRRILGIEDDPLLISGKSLGVVMSGVLLAATLVVLSVTTNTQAKEEGLTTESTEDTENEIEVAKMRAATQNNLKDLAIGLMNYQDVLKHFPPRAKFDADGKPLLSWRVLVLPYLSQAHLNPDSEEAKLYAEFHLDEPWDSDHNRQLIARMPAVFKNPRITKPGMTNYLAVVGQECMFDEAGQPVRIAQVADGTSNTISIVEADADRAVEWTKPEDWEFDRERPTAGLGGLWPNRWYAAWVDGSIRSISNSESPDQVGIQFTRAGGETDSLAESAGRGSEMMAMADGTSRGMVGEMGMGGGEMSGERDPQSVNRQQAIAELQRTKVKIERKLNELHSNFLSIEGLPKSPAPRSENEAAIRKQFQIRAGVLQQQLAATNDSLREKTDSNRQANELANKLKEIADGSNDSSDGAASKFPSLEEQKLADVVYRQLGLELESLTADELKRVRALGFEGGMKVSLNDGSVISWERNRAGIVPNDILVGLHVWPTKSAADVVAVLERDDLAELNPLKYYAVRPGEPSGGGFGPGRPEPDTVGTGRITVKVLAAKLRPTVPSSVPRQSTASGTSATDTQLAPGMKEVREERVDLETGKTQTIITVHPESQPVSPAPRPTLPPARPKPLPTYEPVPIPPFTQAEKAALMKKGPITLLFYFAPDSRPCGEAEKKIAEYEKAFPGMIHVERIDVAAQPELAVQGNIRAVPTLQLRHDRRGFGQIVGTWSVAELEQRIIQYARSRPTLSAPRTLRPNEMLQVIRTGEGESKSPDGKKLDAKNVLLYDGKMFDEWRSTWKTELSMENRLEAVKALAAFGANGRGKEAAEAILEVVQQLDWTYIDNSSAGKLKEACVDAFTSGRTTGGYRILATEWLPLVIEKLRVPSGPINSFGNYIFYQIPAGELGAILPLVELSEKKAFRQYALAGLKAVDPNLENSLVKDRFRQTLSDHNNSPALLMNAIEGLLIDFPNVGGVGGGGIGGGLMGSRGKPPRLYYVPELEPLLFHRDELVRKNARWAIKFIQPADAQPLMKQLLAVIADDNRRADRVEAVRALAAMGIQAKPAESELLEVTRSKVDAGKFAASLSLEQIWGIDGWLEADYERAFGPDWQKIGHEQIQRDLEAERKELFP